MTLGTKKDIDYAVSAAKELLRTWSQTSLEERISYMEKIFIGRIEAENCRSDYRKNWAAAGTL